MNTFLKLFRVIHWFVEIVGEAGQHVADHVRVGQQVATENGEEALREPHRVVDELAESGAQMARLQVDATIAQLLLWQKLNTVQNEELFMKKES